MIIGDFRVRDVVVISNDEKRDIIIFLQGVVYCWCKNRKNEWFSMRNLAGGEKCDLNATPMITL